MRYIEGLKEEQESRHSKYAPSKLRCSEKVLVHLLMNSTWIELLSAALLLALAFKHDIRPQRLQGLLDVDEDPFKILLQPPPFGFVETKYLLKHNVQAALLPMVCHI